MSCGNCGPGYASPAEATKGPREKVLFVTCPHAAEGHDMLAAVDVDPQSDTFCQIISRVVFPNKGDEVHHSGWNACSSCHGKKSAKRSHLIMPCLNSNRIYVANVENERDIKLTKTIEPEEFSKLNISFPHTTHCLADGNIMIATLGDRDDKAKGDFLLLDGATFEPKGTWLEDKPKLPFNYGFWYQPRRDVMVSTEWGAPGVIKEGFDPTHYAEGYYGHSVHIFKWSTREHLQTIELPKTEGAISFEVRFKHEPTSNECYVGSALGSSVFAIRPKERILQAVQQVFKDTTEYEAACIVKIPPKQVSGWQLPMMPGLLTDILISMDDRYLFTTCYLHGDVRQYDISDAANIKMIGQVFVGGSIHTESGVTVTNDPELTSVPRALYVKGKKIEGGPHMMQLSLDGKRLYVTNSMYKKWNEQFYPNLRRGGVILCIDVNGEEGMSLNQDFLIDFSSVEGGPYLAHEMRYPGGDCTSDIWI